MDLILDRRSIIEKEEENNQDKTRNFPDDLIHRIFTFLDMKYVVQTSKLSHNWEHFWKSTDYLNLNCCEFRTQSIFSKFVKHMLSHRSDDVELSKVTLTFKGSTSPTVVRSIVKYAFLHNVRELNMTWFARKFFDFPECLFSSQTLKHLTLATSDQSFYQHNASCIPKLVWDFPALETVFLSNMHFGDKGDESVDLFSKCVNLRDLTLHKCCMSGLRIFHICTPELSDLTITDFTSFPDVFNVVAPKLENFTASVKATVNKCPLMFESLQLTTEGFVSLEKVNLSLSMPHYEQKRFVPLLLDLFRKLRCTKFLVINLDIIEEPQKRSMPQVDDETIAKKVAKLKTKKKVAQEKRKLEANIHIDQPDVSIAELPPPRQSSSIVSLPLP
ncbi:putative FBD-associated F-box protein At1g55030 [Bidens hawaiensis]|uniref:putative FBD-associated F-box protein At1g55030 n=1 Tax=Bidens hawaiensis TaxID=980011 RepID=UPI00404B0C5D